MNNANDTDITDVDKAKLSVESFTRVNDSLNALKNSDMFSGLEPIKKIGLITKTTSEIITAIDNIYTYAKEEENILRELLGMEIAQDDANEDSAGGIRNPGGGGGGGSRPPKDQETKPDPVKPRDPITAPQLTEKLAKLPPSALGGLMKELQALAKKENVTLDQLLKDPKYQDLLKDLFGKWNVSPTLIDKILESDNPGQFLKDLIDGKTSIVVKDDSLKTLKDKLEKIAKDNNITLEQLLTDAKYSDLLKTSLQNIGKNNTDLSALISYILQTSTIGTTLQSILNGTSGEVFTESQFNIIKTYLENIAKENNITLDQLLSDPKYSNLLKTALETVKGNTDVLGAMAGMTKEEAQDYLNKLISGQIPEAFGINSRTLDGVFDYLSEVAKDNNITLEALLSDPKYSELLQTELKNYSNTIDTIQNQLTGKSVEETQNWLRDTYNGATEGASVETIETVRNYIDSLAAQNNVTAEELIMNLQNAETIKNGLNESAKVSVYLSNASTYQGTNTQKYLNDMYTGKNYEAYGFKEENIKSIKTAVEELAKSQNITSEALLTNPEYGATIQSKLSEIDNTGALNTIYSDKSPTTSQTVLKNLCEIIFV